MVLFEELYGTRESLDATSFIFCVRMMPVDVKSMDCVAMLHDVQVPGETIEQFDHAPSAQTEQFVQLEEDAVSAYVAARHQRQIDVPLFDLYFPAGHAKQGPPFGPLCPFMQEQSLRL